MKREVYTLTLMANTPEEIDQKVKEAKNKHKIIATHTNTQITNNDKIIFIYTLFYEEWI